MDDLSVNVRLRPIRFAFMVRPEDGTNLRKIFHVNTCLWGGVYNPIIPFFRRVPAWWERHGFRFESAKQIVNGYLDYFEPDFVVEATKGIANGLGIDAERILQLTDVLPRGDHRQERGYGETVFGLYRKLYRDEFQFVRRHKHDIISVKPAARAFEDFSACLFGAFPRQPNLKYFATAFTDAFDPQEVRLDAEGLKCLYKKSFSSALHMGSRGLEVSFNDHSDPTLFILDAQEPKDLLDFWNYRAIHRTGIAIPVQWLQELSEFCKDFIRANYRPLPGNPHGVMIRPVCMFSRSVSEKEIESLHSKYLKLETQGANTLQVWYPPIWRPSQEIMVRRTRPTVTAAEKSLHVSLDIEKPHIRFDSLHPEFASRFGAENRWANVVHLTDWSHKDRIATVFPTDFRIPAVPRFGLGGDHLLSTNEGLVVFPAYRDIPHSWQLIEGKEAIELWLKCAGITCQLSESGRATQQVIQTLGGFGGVRSIAYKGVISLLEGMARRPITRSAHQRKFENEINLAIKGTIWSHRVLETLVERKAVELGYELKCSKCGSWSWYALHQLNEMVTCDLCLQRYAFPLTRPTDSERARWAYRVVGPFAVPRYAAGGYSAALAIRFFAQVIGHVDRAGTTWSPGQELNLTDNTRVETDFVLWYQRKNTLGLDEPTQIVFGEAKSFGKDAFKAEDIERMKLLADRYPGSTLVFSTLKEAEELSKDEIQRIRKLAEWGREFANDQRQSRAPVVVLTGTEVFTPYHLEEVWKGKGGKHAKLIEPAYVRLDNLRILADITQQLYLNMPSYSSWRQARWEKRRRRRSRA
jgi:hypothetical protein